MTAIVATLRANARPDRLILVLCLAVLATIVLCAFIAPWLPMPDPVAQDLSKSLQPPNAEYPLGTDGLGRDMLSRLVWGARYSLLAGFVPVGVALGIGMMVGLVSAYFGGIVDAALVFLADFLFSLPYFVIALIIVAVLGPGLRNALLAITVGLLPSYIRLSRAAVLQVKSSPYILACHAMGMEPLRIMTVHIVPNIISPLLVYSTIKVGESVLAVAALGFLGLGAQPPAPEWGLMLNNAREQILFAPHAVFFPSLALSITVLSVSLLADALRDRLDPKYRF